MSSWWQDFQSATELHSDASKHDTAEVAESDDLGRKIDMYAKQSSVSRTDPQPLIDAMKSIGDLEGAKITADQLVIPALTNLVN